MNRTRFERYLNPIFGTLRGQLILGVALLNAVMMALFVGYLTESQQEMLLERQTEHATALANSVATSSSGWLAARDYSGLQEIIDAQGRYPDLLFAMILDPQGQVLAHSESAMVGKYLKDFPKAGAVETGAVETGTRLISQAAELVDVASPVVLAGRPIGWVRIGLGQETTARRLRAITRSGIHHAIAAIGIASMAVAIMGWRLTRRLYAIQTVADAIHDGQREKRVRLKGQDEAARLGHAFNSMLDTLAQRENELARHRDHLSELVAERTSEFLRQQIFTQAVLENINDGVVACNERGTLSYFNRATRLIHGVDQEDLPPEHWSEHYRLLQADGVTPMPKELIPLFRAFNGEQVRDQPLIIVNADGTRRFMLCSGQAMFGKTGEKLGAVVSMHDVTAQKQVEAELIKARDAAEAANRAKSVFLANMSHELRTPLNAILGFAELMQRDAAFPEHQRRNLLTINRSGHHLLSLINDILEIAKIEAGRLTLQLGTCDLRDLINTIVEAMELRARQGGLALTLEMQPDLPRFINTDVGKLRQVLINLLSNAIKYTPQGSVDLEVTADAPEGDDHLLRLTFVVRDTGIGVAADDLERIFKPFYQTEQGARFGEGTGLGLTISRQYAELLNGELTAFSEVNQGSAFTFRLPVVVATAAAAEAAESLPRNRHVLGLAEGQASPRILIVEDKEDNLRLLEQLMFQAGLHARAARNGMEAIATFENWHPDLIWMDMRMPVMNGYEATRRIRALPGGREVKIVALTASAFREDRDGIIDAGCDEVLPKPLDEAQMFATVEKLLDVRFRYAEEPAKEAQTSAASIDLSRLPEELRKSLRSAALRLDVEATAEAVGQVRETDPAIADHLEAMVNAYQYDRIVSLCGQAEVPHERQ